MCVRLCVFYTHSVKLGAELTRLVLVDLSAVRVWLHWLCAFGRAHVSAEFTHTVDWVTNHAGSGRKTAICFSCMFTLRTTDIQKFPLSIEPFQQTLMVKNVFYVFLQITEVASEWCLM